MGDLKKLIAAAQPNHSSCFKLLRNSVELRDDDRLQASECLEFLYIPPQTTAAEASTEELQVTIALASIFGIRTELKVPRGVTVKALKELMVKQDPTGTTTLG